METQLDSARGVSEDERGKWRAVWRRWQARKQLLREAGVAARHSVRMSDTLAKHRPQPQSGDPSFAMKATHDKLRLFYALMQKFVRREVDTALASR